VNLYQKINEIKKGVAPLQKDVTVGFGKNAYSAISHDNVLNSVNNLMMQHNVICYVDNVTDDTERTTWQEQYNGQPKQKFKTFTKVRISVTFVNADKPAELIKVLSIGHADDPGDKAAGKALSYAVKYAYLKLFGLSTGQNDEARHNYTQQTQMQQPSFQQPQQGYRQR